ncbi:HK97 family phage prohead protease [Micromonospora sp. WMMA1363]|uniref:HK97 family phage prohead protease n=1 Tax=Micromonospora sp. WMMA1363 TaxID=3053985 RepID=UPI00259CDE8C|nr:HK97 family phage prohead protease [Micromonospora sp. WMMA1363]MDM4718463.1 HK97 family phage prohead protease [Micromonospora sp. WMMA1363]
MMERRILQSEVATRSVGDNRVAVVGYAYTFDARSEDLGGFREMVASGAGRESIAEDDIRALVNHDANLILGRNRAGTLRLAEDSTGLEYEIFVDERQSYVRDLLVALERGDVTQSSFGFLVAPSGEGWTRDADGFPLRTIRAMKLFDVSPVTYPAYPSSPSTISRRAVDCAAAIAAADRSQCLPDVAGEALRMRLRLSSLAA